MPYFGLALALHFNYAVDEMSGTPTLGEFEQVVLLAILRLGDAAYGVTIREEIQARTDREPAPGALYTTLDRLEEKGLITSRLGDPTPQRGGRAKRYFQVSGVGVEAVARAQRAYRRLLEGLKLPGVANA
jgi:DNA-binding PadR family transcriptional regulator